MLTQSIKEIYLQDGSPVKQIKDSSGNVIWKSQSGPTPSDSIYGAIWDGSSTTKWTRTDAATDFVDPSPYYSGIAVTPSSPFDDILPWAGMVKEEHPQLGTVVKIPKFYYKWTREGASMKLQVSMKQHEGFLCSPVHADRGDGAGERDAVYLGRYHCSETDYKSTTGTLPKVDITRAQARTSIHNLGTDIWQWDYAMLWTLEILYLVEFADWDSQRKIGWGGCGSKSVAGLTDTMPYHTGTTASAFTTSGGHLQYRNVEDLWNNVLDWCDGIYFSGANVYCIKNPAQFSDSTGGTLTGTRTTSSGYISAWNTPTAPGFEYALYPSAVSGSGSTYISDRCNYLSSGTVLFVGGSWGSYDYSGLFYRNGAYTASNSNSIIGSRAMYLPPGG